MRLSQVDLDLLVALDAFLRARNVTQAGREIGLSQPAMSAALARLRNLFDDRLFERVGGEYRLTPLAEALADPLQTVLGAVQRTLDYKARFEPAESTRVFRIAVSDHLLLVLCPQLIMRLNELAPEIVVHHAGRGRSHRSPLHRSFDPTDEPRRRLRLPAAVRRQPDLRSLEQKLRAARRAHNGKVVCAAARELRPRAGFARRAVITPPLGTKPNVHVVTRSFACLPFMLPNTGLVAVIQRSLGEWASKQAEISVHELPIPTPRLLFEMSWNHAFSADLALTWLRSVVAEVVQGSFEPTGQTKIA